MDPEKKKEGKYKKSQLESHHNISPPFKNLANTDNTKQMRLKMQEISTSEQSKTMKLDTMTFH